MYNTILMNEEKKSYNKLYLLKNHFNFNTIPLYFSYKFLIKSIKTEHYK